MNIDFSNIERLLNDCQVTEAIALLDDAVNADDAATRAHAFYLRGNAYGKLGDWRNAINNYCSATELCPDSPAAEAYKRAIAILDFYNHDLYNP